ncbi:MAG: hypothetical protein AB1403_06200 [Candidatus Riflebacteria bacterium]
MKKTLLIILLLSLFSPLAAVSADDGSASGEIKPAPWSGDWWSRKKGFMVKGWPGHSPSPLERYDAFVQSRTGKNPGAHAWESNPRNAHYNPNAENWEGHCNGWSAASMLTPEPRKKHVRNGIVFETSDQKAILSELYMNTYCKFYGNRYWGNNNDDPDDIYPDEFHRLLMQYIADGKSAMICDTSWDNQVWNFPLFKFESSWSTGWFDDSKLKVKTTVYYADDGVKPDFLGTKWFSTTYTYNLFLDGNGNIIEGEWTGASSKNHPDFVWVPTGDAPNPPNSNQENPCLDPKFVKEIVDGPETQDLRDGTGRTPDMVIMEAGLNPQDIF